MWNPVVRSELEDRLERAGVNLDEEFYWNLRGKQTRIEVKRKTEITKLAPWAVRHIVRDGEIHISDALAQASFLRSHIAAHSLEDKKWLRVLSIYDVSNIQFLARRLLLESLGHWRYLGTLRNLEKRRGRKPRARSSLAKSSVATCEVLTDPQLQR